jgi:uncharacterized protein YjdB
VDANGTVTFKNKEGKVTITAQSGVSTSVTIQNVMNVTSVRTPLTKMYIQKGKSLTLPIVLDDSTSPKSTINSKLTWKSSNSKVLTVSSKGKIKASKKIKKKTNVMVTVTAANGQSQKIRVFVVPKAKKLSSVAARFPKNLKMKEGNMYQLNVKIRNVAATGVKITFKSSNKGVLRVDKAGKMFALKSGKARVTIKAGNKTYSRTVTVTEPNVMVTFPKGMKVHGTFKLKVKLSKAISKNAKITYSSSNKKIIKVGKDGKLTAVKKGKATITVKVGKDRVKKAIMVK